MPPSEHILGMSSWEETQTQHTLEGLHIPPGEGKLQDPSGAARGRGEEEGRQHYLAKPAATAPVSPVRVR